MDTAESTLAHENEKAALLSTVRELKHHVRLVDLWVWRSFIIALLLAMAYAITSMIRLHDFGWVRSPVAWIIIALLAP